MYDKIGKNASADCIKVHSNLFESRPQSFKTLVERPSNMSFLTEAIVVSLRICYIKMRIIEVSYILFAFIFCF
jgi:hypothetical protein